MTRKGWVPIGLVTVFALFSTLGRFAYWGLWDLFWVLLVPALGWVFAVAFIDHKLSGGGK